MVPFPISMLDSAIGAVRGMVDAGKSALSPITAQGGLSGALGGNVASKSVTIVNNNQIKDSVDVELLAQRIKRIILNEMR